MLKSHCKNYFYCLTKSILNKKEIMSCVCFAVLRSVLTVNNKVLKINLRLA